MTLQTGQLVLLLTNPALAAGYSGAQADPQASLGKFASTTQVVHNASNNLFGAVSAAGVTVGQSDYRCVAVANLSAVDTALSAAIYATDAAGGGRYSLGLDPAGVVDLASAVAQGASIASAFVAPAGVSFSDPTAAAPLSIGNIPPQKCILVWVRCVIAAGTPGTTNDIADIIAFALTQ